MSENNKQQEKLSIIRHSVSHIMAQAVVTLYPGTKVAIGPSIENGFYYDFLLPKPVSADELAAIEAEMKRLIDSKQDFAVVTVNREEALRRFAAEEFKTELINDLPVDAEITIYENRDADGNVLWADLCRGPQYQRNQFGGVQAAEPGGRLLARRREARHAHPHIRNRVGNTQGSESLPRLSRRS
jgi:threonyl-tRNA synthetase